MCGGGGIGGYIWVWVGGWWGYVLGFLLQIHCTQNASYPLLPTTNHTHTHTHTHTPQTPPQTHRFLAGDDAHRNAVFKLIPRIAKGSWIIKQSVGSTPVILGRKLQCSYHRGQVPGSDACYLEVDVDVASSSVAAHVVGLVQVGVWVFVCVVKRGGERIWGVVWWMWCVYVCVCALLCSKHHRAVSCAARVLCLYTNTHTYTHRTPPRVS